MKKQHYILYFFIVLAASVAQMGYSMQAFLVDGPEAAALVDRSNEISGANFEEQKANARLIIEWHNNNNVNTKDAAGVTPLMNAVITGNRRLFDAACKLGASLHLHDNQGRTAYYYATQKLIECDHVGHEHCCPFAFMKESLEGGINEVDPSNDMTPLMTAAQAGNVNMVLWLLGHGADVTTVGNYNKTKTAYNIAKDESIKKVLEFKGAKEFEVQHAALQAKKREEITLKLLQNQQKKQLAQIRSDALYEERVKDYLKNNTMAVKSFLFGAIFNRYKETINLHLDPAVIDCKKDLLQRVFIRLLLTCKNKGHAPEQVQQVLGDSMAHMVMQAGCFLGEKRLALMGCKKKGPLAFSELVRLVYAQDKKITRESDKIDADVDIILFMSHWKKARPLLLKEFGEGAQITSQQAHNMLLQAGDNNKQMKPEQIQVMLHVQNEIYKLLLQDYPRAVQAVAAAQDSLGNSPLHYAVVLNDFELAKELIGAQAALEKLNARKTAPLDLIIKMGNSDQLKDLFVVAGNSIKPTVFKKAVPTEKEVEALVKVSAAAGAGRGNPVKTFVKADLEVVQANLKKDILRAACAKAPSRPANNVVAAQPEQVDAQKLASLQKAQELEAAQLAKEQEAQKIAKQAAKKAAKKERRKATKMEEEQAIEQLKLDAEKKRHADELLARNKKAQRAEQDKAQANRAFEEAQLHEQKRKLELEKLEQVQQKRIEVQQKLEQAQLSAQASKLQLERQLQESAAQKIYFQHTARPDIYIDEDQAPTDYAQWLHEHRLAEGAYCLLCNKASVIKAQIYKEDAVQEQLQRRKTAMDWKFQEEALLARKEQERLKKLEVAKKKQALQEQLAERVKQIEQRLSPQNKA